MYTHTHICVYTYTIIFLFAHTQTCRSTRILSRSISGKNPQKSALQSINIAHSTARKKNIKKKFFTCRLITNNLLCLSHTRRTVTTLHPPTHPSTLV